MSRSPRLRRDCLSKLRSSKISCHQLISQIKLGGELQVLLNVVAISVLSETNRVPKIANSMESSLQASSPGRFGGGAGKGRRACNGCQLNASWRINFFFNAVLG